MTEEEILLELISLGFGRIVSTIRLYKGQPELEPYFEKLMMAPSHDAQGFPSQAFSLLAKLYLLQGFPEKTVDHRSK